MGYSTKKKLAGALLKRIEFREQCRCMTLVKRIWKRLCRICKHFRTYIDKTNPFEQAQICAGGVDTSEIDPDTMESKLVKGLYFAGEILDVDGICGGYNLQWAWTSGYLAGKGAEMLRISQLKLPVTHTEEDLKKKIVHTPMCRTEAVQSYEIIKNSLWMPERSQSCSMSILWM